MEPCALCDQLNPQFSQCLKDLSTKNMIEVENKNNNKEYIPLTNLSAFLVKQ